MSYKPCLKFHRVKHFLVQSKRSRLKTWPLDVHLMAEPEAKRQKKVRRAEWTGGSKSNQI